MISLIMMVGAMAQPREKGLSYNKLDANIGALARYNMGAPNSAALGMNYNIEFGVGEISKDLFPTSIYFNGRADVDVSGIWDVDSNQISLELASRLNAHIGFQFFGFMPVNIAIKDAGYGFFNDSFSNFALYGVGILLPKEFINIQDEDTLIALSLNIGARVRDEFSASPAAFLPEFRYLGEEFSARVALLTTIGSSDSRELSGNIFFAKNNLIEHGTQLGILARYEKLEDTTNALDTQNISVSITFGGNPKFNFD